VRLTDRGWSALEVIRHVAVELEQTWADALGEELYRTVRQGLACLERTLDESLLAEGARRGVPAPRRTPSEPGR
jgi:hypothetical protein